MAAVKRSVRIGERLREQLADLLGRQVHDPRVLGVVLSRVSMTDDLQLARVYVRLSAGGDDEAKRRALLAGLDSASGLLRRELGRSLNLRYAPRLAFHYDEAQEKRSRIDALLAEIEQGEKAKE